MSKHISQIDLIGAIVKHLDARHGITGMLPREMNAIIAAANLVVDEFAKPVVLTTPGMGLGAWLASDGTGMSSKFMSWTLTGFPFDQAYVWPHDPSDFGRCLGLLDAVPELRSRLHEMAATGREWKVLVDAWDELEALYREESPSGNAPRLYDRMRELLRGKP